MMLIEECRKAFEDYIKGDFKKAYIFARPGILNRTPKTTGILREYDYQETELMWRSFKHAWFLNKQENGTIEQLEEKVWVWAEERDLYNQSTKESRIRKAYEELDEFVWEVLSDGTMEDIKLEAGDVLVTMINNLKPMGLNMEQCLSAAYEKIKNRKGAMVGGTFVKE